MREKEERVAVKLFMSKVDCIIYSKNRACQLDLLLRSIKDHFKSVGNIYILYTYSNSFFEAGYNKFFDKWKNYVLGFEQLVFENDVRTIINNMKSPYFLGICDDDVFMRETDCTDILEKFKDPDVNAISLKGGLNIIGNYPERPYPLPTFVETDPFLKWEWRKYDVSYDWGYPSCMNPFIFMKDYFLSAINDMRFNYPTELEGGFHLRRGGFRKYMVSFRESKVLNIPANRIQNLSPNLHSNNINYSADEMNRKFLSGQVISTSRLYNTPMKMGNEERDYVFEKE